MSNTVNAYRPRITSWQVLWGPLGSAFDFGLNAKVQPDLKPEIEPIKRAASGKGRLGAIITGLQDGSTIKLAVPDLHASTFLANMPWVTGDAPQTLTPPTNEDLYQYAQLLTLHPRDMGGDASEDLSLIKAVPMTIADNVERDGENQGGYGSDIWNLEFMLFFDVSNFSSTGQKIYGYLGPVPD